MQSWEQVRLDGGIGDRRSVCSVISVRTQLQNGWVEQMRICTYQANISNAELIHQVTQQEAYELCRRILQLRLFNLQTLTDQNML